MRLFRRVRKYSHHTIAGYIHGKTGILREAKILGSCFTKICQDHAWIHGKGVEPGVLAIDTHDVPVNGGFGRPITRIRNGWLISINR